MLRRLAPGCALASTLSLLAASPALAQDGRLPVELGGELLVDALVAPARPARTPFEPTLPQLLSVPPKTLQAVRAAAAAHARREREEIVAGKPKPARRKSEQAALAKGIKLLEAIERGPREEMAYALLLFYRGTLDGDIEPAMPPLLIAADKARDVDPALECEARTLMADMLVAVGRSGEAFAALLESEALPDDTGCPVAARRRQAELALADGKLDEARGHYKRNFVGAAATDCAPARFADGLALAWLAFRAGDCREVLQVGARLEKAADAEAACRAPWDKLRPEWVRIAGECVAERGAGELDRILGASSRIAADVKARVAEWQAARPAPSMPVDLVKAAVALCYGQAVRATPAAAGPVRVVGGGRMPTPDLMILSEPGREPWTAAGALKKCVSSRLARNRWRGPVSGEMVVKLAAPKP